MNRTPRPLVRLPWLIAALGLFAVGAPAQQTSTTEDETIVLSPFVVSSDSDNGYYSPQAVSGTRTKTRLMDLPMNLNVLNDAFIKDLGARDLKDVVTYTAGAVAAPATSGDTAHGDTTGFTIRGFGTHLPYRNGFRRIRVVDTANVSRIEVIKGPASVLYGTAFAGGSVNYITKRPEWKNIADVTLRMGSYDLYRTEGDFNVQVLPKKLAVRFVGAYEDSGSWARRAHTDLQLLNPSMTYWFRPDSYITFEYERERKSLNAFQGQLPYHPLLDLQSMDLKRFRSWNTHAKGDYMDNTMDVYTVELVHRFAPWLTLRANYTREEWYEATRQNGDSGNLVLSSAYSGSPWLEPARLASRQLNAYAKRGSLDDYAQGELVNNFSVKGVDVQTMFGVQRSIEDFHQFFGTLSPGPTFGGRAPVQWVLADPSTWFVTEETEANVTGFSSNSGSTGRSIFSTMYLTNQLSFLDGRVHTLAGYRIDEFKSDGHGATISTSGAAIPNPTQNAVVRLPKYKTPQLGLLVKPRQNISLYAQYSESVVNLFTTNQRREDGTSFVPTPGRGKGYEGGVKVEALDSRLNVTLGLFRIDNANLVRILASRPDPQNPGNNFTPADQGGVQRSEGFDLDVQWRPTKNTQIVFAYANIDAYVLEATEFVVINGEKKLTRQGHQLANAPRHSGSIWVRQDLGKFGWMKNVYVAGGARYAGSRPTSDTYIVSGYTGYVLNPGQTAIASNGNNVNFTGGTLVAPWRLDSYTVFDVTTGWNFELGKQRYSAAINLKNVFDKAYLEERYHVVAPRTIEARLTVSF